MRKIVVMIVVMFVLNACGNDKVINGKNYHTYGLINADQEKDPKVRYEVIIGNVFWSIILFETIAAPVYFWGFSLYQPVGSK